MQSYVFFFDWRKIFSCKKIFVTLHPENLCKPMEPHTDNHTLELALLNRARHYCAAEEQCEFDVRNKLDAWGVDDEEMADRIVDRLVDEGYLDAVRYATRYAESKMLHAHWGRDKVAYQLRLKRLPSATVRQALESVDDEVYLQMLADLAAKKFREYADERKLTRFLLSRGFRYAEINQVLINILPQ